MIRAHAFNSEWWGSAVGIVDDPKFFELDVSSQNAMCEPFAWIEFSTAMMSAPAGELLLRAGFYLADVQVHFRVNLAKVTGSPSLQSLVAETARDSRFEISASKLRDFEHERFLQLPGSRPDLINSRYAIWSNRLIESHPATCLQISNESGVQGWFMAEREDRKPMRLTLAVLHVDANISGHLLYQKAMMEFAAAGARIGEASFSATNTAVMNIYSSFDARFFPPTGHWLRSDDTRPPVSG